MKVVLKYGGTSVNSIEKIKNIAKYVKNLTEKQQVVVVVSAMGKTTNNLIEKANFISAKPNLRDLDMLLAIGEMETASLLSIALNEIGAKSVALTGGQAGVKTNSVFSRAFIEDIIPKRIIDELQKKKVVIVCGFQGVNSVGDITTLGRGGSDTTAVALATALKCGVEIYTDVDSVYTIDPNIYPNAKSIQNISFDEMLEMTVKGAKILDARSVEIAKKFNTKIYLGKSMSKNKKDGTIISNAKFFEEMPIKNISIKKNISSITIKIKKTQCEIFTKIFDTIVNSLITLDMLNCSEIENEIVLSFVIDNVKLNSFLPLFKEIKKFAKIEIKQNINKISVVGIGFSTHTNITNRIISKLIEHNVPITQISNSELSLSFSIDDAKVEEIITTLAREFDL